MKHIKKSLITAVIGITACSTTLFATDDLSVNVNDLNLKLERVKQINSLTVTNKEQNNKIEYLNKELKDTKYSLKKAEEHVKAAEINIQSLTENTKTLRDLKAKLESDSLKTQEELQSNYNENLILSQTQEKTKLSEMLKQNNSDRTDLKKQIEDLNSKLASRNKSIEQLQNTIVNNEDTITALNSNISTLANQKKELEKASLQTQNKLTLDYTNNTVNSQKHQKETLDKLLAEYTADKKSLASNIEDLSSKLASRNKSIEQLENTIQNNKDTITALNSNISTLANQKKELEKASLETQNKLTLDYTNNTVNSQKHQKETLDNLLVEYTADKKSLASNIEDLKSEIANKSKAIDDLKNMNSTKQSNIDALNSTILTLTEQKKTLEDNTFNTHNTTIANYKAEIDVINQSAENKIDAIKQQYKELTENNNLDTQKSKENYDKMIDSKKRILVDQLENLITSVNKYQSELFTTAQDMSKNADEIYAATEKLNKAYKDAPSPFPKKNLYNKTLTNVGLQEENPNWLTITTEVDRMRDNISTIRKLSDELGNDNINNNNLLTENKTVAKTNLWNLWGLI